MAYDNQFPEKNCQMANYGVNITELVYNFAATSTTLMVTYSHLLWPKYGCFFTSGLRSCLLTRPKNSADSLSCECFVWR